MVDMASRISCFFSTTQQSPSDNTRHGAHTDSDPVMADQTTHHVVNSDRSTAEQSSVDVYAKPSPSAPAAPGNNFVSNPSDSADSAPDALSTSQSSPPSHHVSSEQTPGHAVASADQRVNGVPYLSVDPAPQDSSAVDDGIAGDNIGSDTDTSRAGSVDQSKDENRLLPSNSNKKPASFRPVSVTKTFLAKTAGTAPPTTTKVGSRSPVASTVQPVAKPRLVAKSGSGLRDIPRVRSDQGAAAPDGRMVWNKNQREHKLAVMSNTGRVSWSITHC